jgi:hypothetical protein
MMAMAFFSACGFNITAGSTSMFFLLASAAASTAGSSLNP